MSVLAARQGPSARPRGRPLIRPGSCLAGQARPVPRRRLSICRCALAVALLALRLLPQLLALAVALQRQLIRRLLLLAQQPIVVLCDAVATARSPTPDTHD
jgi:hypothetical protein